MSQSRTEKFERMLRFQTNQLDLVKQRIQTQQSCIAGLKQDLAALHQKTKALQSGDQPNASSVASLQLTELSILELSKRMKLKKSEITQAQEQLDHLLHVFQEEDRRLKGWEKLVERETLKTSAALQNHELQQADELFLISRFAGEHR